MIVNYITLPRKAFTFYLGIWSGWWKNLIINSHRLSHRVLEVNKHDWICKSAWGHIVVECYGKSANTIYCVSYELKYILGYIWSRYLTTHDDVLHGSATIKFDNSEQKSKYPIWKNWQIRLCKIIINLTYVWYGHRMECKTEKGQAKFDIIIPNPVVF